MKSFPLAVAIAILTVFAFAPSELCASAAAASDPHIAADSKPSSVAAHPIAIAQLSADASVDQGEGLQAQQDSGAQDSSADTDNQNAGDANENAGDTDQNSDADNGADADQTAQTDDNGDNSAQESGNANDSQADNGDTGDQSAENAAAAR